MYSTRRRREYSFDGRRGTWVLSKESQSEIADAREESDIISQIRIYTINKGEMDNFLKHFREEIMPLHEKIGVPIVGSWVNRPQNEFIWVRTYKDKAEIEAKTKEFQTAVAAAGVKLGGNVAKMEVREAESVFT
jgi:hypothetical protein